MKDGVRRIVVLNGLESEKQRGAESRRLLNVAFNDFARKTLFEAGARVGAAEVFAGKAPSVPLTLAEPITLTAHRAQLRNVRATIVYKGPLEAPVPAGAQVGFLRVEYDDKVREAPLFTAEEAPAVGLFGRISLAAKKLLLKPEAPTLADASSNGSASD